jgi:iron complex outermembrane receptor protein
MRERSLLRVARSETGGRVIPPARAPVAAAVFVALYGMPGSATAQVQSTSDRQQTEAPSGALQEIVVTATRRAETLEAVPYSITAISADQIENAGVTDLASLANQVPGMSMYNVGARSAASAFPIIRGVNAADANLDGFHTLEQTPVGTYIGNSPIDGYFQLDDIQRVEVLRGPQGTLYGAGALGGAVRIIPSSPELGQFAGKLEVGGGTIAHSSSASYTTAAMLNVPIGDALAFRVSGKYAYEPGFINAYGILQRSGSFISGIPVLANPKDPVNSPGIFTGKKDWNDQNTFTGRASLLWKPADEFDAEFAFIYSNVNGDGGPFVNTNYSGGPYPIDPRITFPSGGANSAFSAVDQPFSRRSTLGSVDLSYDAGFATLSSTSSYLTTNGSTTGDGTYLDASFPTLLPYYAGLPVNPRWVLPDLFTDSAHTFTQEVRLVSKTGHDTLFDYVVGVFYENQEREGLNDLSNPGSPERAATEGCTAPYFGGASFPNCLTQEAFPGDIYFQQVDTQRFQDKSVFGELTWHFLSQGQLTLGGRHTKQSFSDAQSYVDPTFGANLPAMLRSSPASKNTFKINPSYEYATGQYVYAVWSQGFRRGGANSVPEVGFFAESPELRSYRPDSVNNYETGLKGRFSNGLTYAFDVFDIFWDNPQVGDVTPITNLAVWNAKKAKSTGVEFDLRSPLLLRGLSVSASGAYAHARFTEDYLIAADAYGSISGKAGDQLPGSPKSSAAASINYDSKLLPGYDLTVSVNDTYRSRVPLTTFTGVTGAPVAQITPGMNIVNLSASVTHQSWRLGAYATNVANKRVDVTPHGLGVGSLDNLPAQYGVNQPREISLRLRYSFGSH